MWSVRKAATGCGALLAAVGAGEQRLGAALSGSRRRGATLRRWALLCRGSQILRGHTWTASVPGEDAEHHDNHRGCDKDFCAAFHRSYNAAGVDDFNRVPPAAFPAMNSTPAAPVPGAIRFAIEPPRLLCQTISSRFGRSPRDGTVRVSLLAARPRFSRNRMTRSASAIASETVAPSQARQSTLAAAAHPPDRRARPGRTGFR